MPLGNALNLQFGINQLIFANTATNIVGLATAANGILATSAGSVPSITTTLPLAVQNNITNLGTIVSIGAPLGAQFGGTGITNLAGSTITLGGAFSMIGAFTFAGTLTGNTAVTFPTSGTLATTAGASGIVNPGLINQIAYYAAAGSTVSGLATAINGLLVTSNTGVPSILAGPGTTGQILQSNAAGAPSFSTASYPSTTTINQLLFSSAANVVTGLATLASAALITSAGGVPSLSQTLPIAVQNNITNLGTIASIGAPLGAAFGGTGVTNAAGSTITLGGALSTIGAFTAAFTFTGNTAVTFPTSGTLATTASASGTVNTGLINQLAYYASAGSAVSGLAIVNSAGLLTNGSGVPGWVAYTGTGAPVLATSPTLITPTLGAALATSVRFSATNALLDSSGNVILAFNPLGSANNWIISNQATGLGPVLQAVGSDTNIVGTLTGKGNGGITIQGTAAGGNANTGYVGELVSSVIPSGSAVSLVSATAKNLTSISLSAGDWDVYGNVFFNGSTANMTTVLQWCSLTTAALPDSSLYAGVASILTNAEGGTTPYLRVNVSTTTNVFISGFVIFSTGTVSMNGGIYARRVR